LVRSGRYQNASEVLREGLRLVERREAEHAARLAELRAAANLGWADIAAGRYTDVEVEHAESFVAGLSAEGPAEATAGKV
jgi:antitoxin ParD1/3/4